MNTNRILISGRHTAGFTFLQRCPALPVTAALSLALAPELRAADYASEVLLDGPVAYYRLGEAPPVAAEGAVNDPARSTAVNKGSAGSAADGLHFPGAKHGRAGALAGSTDTAIGFSVIDKTTGDGGVPTIIPYTAELNPDGPFTVEVWMRPASDGRGNAQGPLRSRMDIGGNRNGWDMYQRGAGTGWNWRIFNGEGSGKVFDLTGGPYVVGEWCHVVCVYNVTSASLYVNGTLAASSSAPVGSFSPNPSGRFSIGGIDNSSENPFDGDMDEVAVYGKALSAADVATHFANARNAARALPYETLVANDGAVVYYRMNEPEAFGAANLGTAGSALDGAYANPFTALAGPQAPAFAGFEADNASKLFDGTHNYIDLGNPEALNFDNAMTLEAWVQPDATQANATACILAHGGNSDFGSELALRLENGEYQLVSKIAANSATEYKITSPVPTQDFEAGVWTHLAATFDGTRWVLYRNGKSIGLTTQDGSKLNIPNANWSIGARGRWSYGFGFPDNANPAEQRTFSGGIDETAIYNKALSAERIADHYLTGLATMNPITITTSASGVTTLTWRAGTGALESSTDLSSWAAVNNATSPYTVPAEDSKRFYRLRF